MSDRLRSLVTGLGTVLFFFIVLFGIIPNHIRVPENLANFALSPAFWPSTVCIIGIVLGSIIVFRAALNLSMAPDDQDMPAVSAAHSELRGLAAIAGMFAYFGLIYVLGIVAASILVIPGLALLYGERRFVKLAVVAVLLPLALYYFFTLVVRIPLPLGVFERLL